MHRLTQLDIECQYVLDVWCDELQQYVNEQYVNEANEREQYVNEQYVNERAIRE